ncbi:MAG: biotin--[acetyl-CoA-carboxylase] ligase [Actinobacteria bacterium]|nr:biotin--[acetyl-CoA-carboxylase] ligase [Actinomycetota bacterium]
MKNFDTEKFSKLLNTAKFGRKMAYFSTISSTNDYSAELIKNTRAIDLKGLDGTLVLAEIQTCGRGRFRRKWLSPEGGLWFSLIFTADLRPEELPNLTLIAAFSISEALMDTYSISVDIKWPNDLYYGEYKFGGILSELKKEGQLQIMILGAGLNVNICDTDISKLESAVTSIQKILGKTADRELLMAKILGNFERSYNYFSTTGDFGTLFKKMEKSIRYQ